MKYLFVFVAIGLFFSAAARRYDDDDEDTDGDAEEHDTAQDGGDDESDDEPAQEQSDDRPNAAPKSSSVWRFPVQDDYYLEIAMLVFLVLYVANIFYGRRVNDAIAVAWWVANKDLLEKNFSRVAHDSGAIISQESSNVFKFYCTGRINCRSVVITLNLRKRHDLVSLFMELFSPVEDTVTLDVFLSQTAAQEVEPFLLAVVQRKRAKAYLRDTTDLAKFAVIAAHDRLNAAALTLIADSAEVAPALLTPEVLQTLETHAALFRVLHVTDQSPFTGEHARAMRIVLALPKPADAERAATLMRMSMFLIDQVARVRLSAGARKKAQELRQKATLEAEKKARHEEMQAQAQKKRIERMRAEKEEFDKRLKTMSPEEQRRAEEARHRRAVKEKMKHQKTIVMRA